MPALLGGEGGMIGAGGDAWRWDVEWQRYRHPHSRHSISVIEPAEKREDLPGARRVPYGFARALYAASEQEPLLWDGDQA